MANHVPEGVPFVWEQAEKRLDAQLRHADALDTKAGGLVGLHAVAAGLVATFAHTASGRGRWVAIAVIAGLVVSGFLALLGFRVEGYARDPSPEELWRFGAWEPEAIQYRLLAARFTSLRANAIRLERKARYVARSLVGLAVIALMVATTGIVALVVR